MTHDTIAEEVLPVEQALKRIRILGRGRKVYLCVNQHAPIAGDAGKVFPIYGNIYVGRAAAIEFVKDAYTGFAERGAMVTLRYYDNILFVG